MKIPDSDKEIYCDISTPNPWPHMTVAFRKPIFDAHQVQKPLQKWLRGGLEHRKNADSGLMNAQIVRKTKSTAIPNHPLLLFLFLPNAFLMSIWTTWDHYGRHVSISRDLFFVKRLIRTIKNLWTSCINVCYIIYSFHFNQIIKNLNTKWSKLVLD